ncbi:MAG: Uma2 family endonuclease [Turicibacter sp.]|nr:Uma2 family endonuclease [Turicibacter sp.]
MEIFMSDYIAKMANMPRHGRLVSGFSAGLTGSGRDLYFRNELFLYQENLKLMYMGSIQCGLQLFDFEAGKSYSDQQKEESMAVLPDVMIFNRNRHERLKSRIFGSPDLVVEIWSEANDDNHRDFKKLLYSSSKNTEHWYLTQDSDVVECWRATEQLPSQNLADILRTASGLEFDLRNLAGYLEEE